LPLNAACTEMCSTSHVAGHHSQRAATAICARGAQRRVAPAAACRRCAGESETHRVSKSSGAHLLYNSACAESVRITAATSRSRPSFGGAAPRWKSRMREGRGKEKKGGEEKGEGGGIARCKRASHLAKAHQRAQREKTANSRSSNLAPFTFRGQICLHFVNMITGIQ
jgi:hypothetical protein